jgi:hypothetical protein
VSSQTNPTDESPSKRFTVQHPTYLLGLCAVKLAVQHQTLGDLLNVLREDLPFNSKPTRKSFTSRLRHWALDRGNLDALGVRVWRAYGDELLTNQVLQERYLNAYPIIGRFVTDVLGTLPPDIELDRSLVCDYLSTEQVGALSKSVKTLRYTMRDMRLIRTVGRAKDVVTPTPLPNTAFLVLLHHHLARTPATVPVAQILEHPFWRYLGGRDEGEVRTVLSLAAARDLIARYARVDNLEQITTRFSLDEFLQRKVRLDP